MTRERRRTWRWAGWTGVALYAAVIFAVSSIPAKSMPPGRFWDFDKLIHAAEYSVLGGLLALAFGRTRRGALWAWLLASAYGVSDELHQGFVPGRMSSVGDVLADIVGAGLGVLVVCYWRKSRDQAPLRVP